MTTKNRRDRWLECITLFIVATVFASPGILALYVDIWQYDCSRCRDTRAEPAPNMWPVTERAPFFPCRQCRFDGWMRQDD
jgi:hypothetical protein